MIILRPLSPANTRSTARRSASSKSKLIGCPVYCFGPEPGTSWLNVGVGCGAGVGGVGGCVGGCAGGCAGGCCVCRASAARELALDGCVGGATRACGGAG